MGNCNKREAGPKGDFVGAKPTAVQAVPAQPKTEQEVWIAQREAEQDAEFARARHQRATGTAGQPGTFQVQQADGGQQGGMFRIMWPPPAAQAASPQDGGPDGHVALRELGTGVMFVLPFTSDETVITLKRKLQILSGLPAGDMALSFKGKRLDDLCTLGDYSVQNESVIFFIRDSALSQGYPQ